MEVGIKISQLRKNRKLSQPELAHHLGISQTALCEIESGKTKKIDFLLMDKVCKFFEVDTKYFLEETPVINNVKKATNCNIGCENGAIHNPMPEGVLENIIHRLTSLETTVSNFINKKEGE